MEHTRLGRTDLQVSRICFGTWQFGGDWGEFDEAEAIATVRRALDLGIVFFDTAQAYGFGRSEALLGKALAPALARDRDRIVIATKGGLRREGGRLLRDSSPAFLREGLEASLAALGVERIDVYQVHWPDAHTPLAETARALQEFVDEGKVRCVGVSNFDVAQMREFARTRPVDTLQPAYHLLRREIEAEVLPHCAREGIGVFVYGPLAHGLLTGKYDVDATFPPGDWRASSPVFRGESLARNVRAVRALEQVARARGQSVAQLAIAWTLAHPAVHAAIVGARDRRQLDEDAAACDALLTPDELRRIDAILAEAVPVGGPAPEAAS